MAMLLFKCSVYVFVYDKGDTCSWEDAYYGCDDSVLVWMKEVPFVESMDTFSAECFGNDVAR
jgi:hypothetical protein